MSRGVIGHVQQKFGCPLLSLLHGKMPPQTLHEPKFQEKDLEMWLGYVIIQEDDVIS